MAAKAVIMHSRGGPGRVAILPLPDGSQVLRLNTAAMAIAADSLLKQGVLTEAHLRLYFAPEKLHQVLDTLRHLGIEAVVRQPEGS